MEWTNELNPINGVKCKLEDDGLCVLTWNWPVGVQYVYIYGFDLESEIAPEQLSESDLKLFTREEYKAKSGYSTRLERTGGYGFRIFPCLKSAGNQISVLLQQDDGNFVKINTKKARIHYSIKYKKHWFGGKKSVIIKIRSEVYIPNQTLCYVKKEGARPLNREDGLLYRFPRDIQSGAHTYPKIEIHKSDSIGIFLTDTSVSGKLYDLIPE